MFINFRFPVLFIRLQPTAVRRNGRFSAMHGAVRAMHVSLNNSCTTRSFLKARKLLKVALEKIRDSFPQVQSKLFPSFRKRMRELREGSRRTFWEFIAIQTSFHPHLQCLPCMSWIEIIFADVRTARLSRQKAAHFCQFCRLFNKTFQICD